MAYTDFGQLFPSEAGFKTPGMYGAFLQAEGAKKAAYLSDMDQFFASLAETTRRFNAELGFKEKELASREALTREEYTLRRELQDEELEYRRWMIEQTTASQERIARIGAESRTGSNYLGGPSSREIWDAMQKNRAVSTRTTTEPRFQTVDPTTGRLRPAGAGELYSQVDEPYRTNYGQGGTSGVADYENYEDWG